MRRQVAREQQRNPQSQAGAGGPWRGLLTVLCCFQGTCSSPSFSAGLQQCRIFKIPPLFKEAVLQFRWNVEEVV